MPADIPLVLNIAIALAAAALGGFISSRLRQSPIVGYLLAGIAIGPFTPGFIGNIAQIAALADVGVIFLMFALGVAFSLRDLATLRMLATLGSIVQVLVTLAGGLLFGVLAGWQWQAGLFLGAVLAASSSMVILKTLLDRGEIASGHGRLLLSMSIVQDICVVLLAVLMPQLIRIGGMATTADLALQMALLLLKAAGFIGFSLVIGLRVVPRVMSLVAQLHSSELFIVTAAVLALGAAAVSTLLGLSAMLGAFIAGLVLSDTEYDHRVIAEVVPLRDLFATLFFVSVGMLIDVRLLVHQWDTVLLVATGAMALKFLATFVAIAPFRVGLLTTTYTSLGMIPVGELNYVVAFAALQAEVFSRDLYNVILAASLVTIVLTPMAFAITPRVAAGLRRVPGLGGWLSDAPGQGTRSGAALRAHAVVVGYGRVGQHLAEGLGQAGMPVVVVESNLAIVRELTTAGAHAVYGDATSTTVMGAARIQDARLVVLTLPTFSATRAAIQAIRRQNRTVPIIARGQDAHNEDALRAAGADVVVVPELAGSATLLDHAVDVADLPR
ncbi:MAG: cation:proton antiporter [Gammaproteobacteria bacterium]|jgi:CPA2 family monovalent cation:H+ antiporter-2|nr:cation:proton antiporter [Gammaproteobacteria bacterium]